MKVIHNPIVVGTVLSLILASSLASIISMAYDNVDQREPPQTTSLCGVVRRTLSFLAFVREMDIRRGLVYNRVEQRDFLKGGRRMSKVCRTAHSVYCLNYHFVWVPQYRRDVLTGYVAERAEEIFCEIAERYEFKVEAVNIGGGHVHIFLSALPRYSPARIVNIMKSISAKKLFEDFPRVKEKLWGANSGLAVTMLGQVVKM